MIGPSLQFVHLTPPAALQDGLCARGEHPDLWYADDRGQGLSKETLRAKQICMRCPLRQVCLEYALENREAFGTWGGLTADERGRLLKKRAAA